MMHWFRLRRRSLLFCGITLLATFAITSMGLAGRPGGGGGGGTTPVGRIVFRWYSEFDFTGQPGVDRGVWSMNADGTDKTEGYGPADMVDLSHQTHVNHRWYLATDVEAGHPARGSLYAVRDDGDPAYDVLLLEGADLPGTRYLHWSARWGKEDTFISLTAFDDVDDVGEIWAVAISFDAASGVPGLASAPVGVVSEPLANIGLHDWSPLGDEVVYTRVGDAGGLVKDLMIRNLAAGETRLLLTDAQDPLWSPEGSKIAFQGLGVEVINLDGTGRIPLADGYLGDWSPDGQHITYSSVWLRKNKYYSDVRRISASGGTGINLTKDIDGFASPSFWRQ